MLDQLLLGFSVSLSPENLFYCLIGCILGTVVGVLPGLGPAATIALLLPLTFKMDVTSAIIMLSGIYYGVAYGGTITSVLMNIPGEASSIMTCLDGHQMAKKGRGGVALGIAAFGSFIGTTFSIIGITLLAPPLAKLALNFGPAEYTSLMIAGMSLVVYLSSKSVMKSLAMAILGLIIGCIGLDPITGTERFTFGWTALVDGIDIAPLAMGLFGLAEVFEIADGTVRQAGLLQRSMSIRSLFPTRKEWKDSLGSILRATPLGFFLGILPGGGAVMASFVSYAMEKRLSRHPEKFGTGIIEGVAAPETANNSGTAGAFIPLLTLGLPFNVITALLLAAFMVHGVAPGPLILKNHADIFWGVVTSMYVGNVMLLILNIPLIGIFINILRIPYPILTPLIAAVCFVGAYSVNSNAMDVVVLITSGLIGYLMRKFGYDAAPLLLAFVLGPILERSLRQALILSDGSPSIFVSEAISAALLSVVLLLILSPALRAGWRILFPPRIAGR